MNEKTAMSQHDLEFSKELPQEKTFRARVRYFMETVYLVTRSDLKTTLLPATVFAITNVSCGSLFHSNSTPSLPIILARLLKSVIWTWLNLWIFNLSNQRLPHSILEDSINKPWRAIPSGRLSASQARYLLLGSIPLVYLSTFYLGGREESLALMVLTWIYNDLGLADEHYLLRHLNNALGFTTFGAGAAAVACSSSPLSILSIFSLFSKTSSHGSSLSQASALPALGSSLPLNATAYIWLSLIALTITFTIQFQDMEDQDGDRLRSRRTLPLVLGDSIARYINALSILVFSLAAPAFWRLGNVGYAVPGVLGVVIAVRTLVFRGVKADRGTFKLWCGWLIVLYLLPLLKRGAMR